MGSATELIEGILRDFPDHRPGTRPVHAYGVVAEGRFRPSDIASRFTAAAPFTTPGGVPVTVRFSNGTGNAGVSEARRDVRGMAARFHGGPEATFDLVSMTIPTFFVRTVEGFQSLTRAAEPPVPPVTRSRWQDVVDLLHLRTPAKDADPGDAGVVQLSERLPEACPALVANFNAATPESYATLAYHAVHAFRLRASDGAECSVRFTWEPVAGVRASPTTEAQYLRDDLIKRMAVEPVRFVLRAQVADQGDRTGDPTRPWPRTRRRLVLGHLMLDRCGDTGEALEFNPHNLPAGIRGDDEDRIFAVRGEVYAESAARRAQLRRD